MDQHTVNAVTEIQLETQREALLDVTTALTGLLAVLLRDELDQSRGTGVLAELSDSAADAGDQLRGSRARRETD